MTRRLLIAQRTGATMAKRQRPVHVKRTCSRCRRRLDTRTLRDSMGVLARRGPRKHRLPSMFESSRMRRFDPQRGFDGSRPRHRWPRVRTQQTVPDCNGGHLMPSIEFAMARATTSTSCPGCTFGGYVAGVECCACTYYESPNDARPLRNTRAEQRTGRDPHRALAELKHNAHGPQSPEEFYYRRGPCVVPEIPISL